MKLGQQLHPSRAPSEPQSGFLGTVQVQFLDKVADMPDGVQLQYVDKVVDFPVVQVVQFQSARREKTVLSHSCRSCTEPTHRKRP